MRVTDYQTKWLFILSCFMFWFAASAQKPEKIINHKISNTAMVYQIVTEADNKLVVYNMIKKDSLVFDKTFEKMDVTDSSFIGFDQIKNELQIVSVDNFQIDIFRNVSDYDLLADQKTILIFNESTVILYNLKSKSYVNISKVERYFIADHKDWIFIIFQDGSVSRYSTKSKKTEKVRNLNISHSEIVKSYWVKNHLHLISIRDAEALVTTIDDDLTYRVKGLANEQFNATDFYNLLNNSIMTSQDHLMSYLLDKEVEETSKGVAVFHSNVYDDDQNFRKEKADRYAYYFLDFEKGKIINLSLKYKNYDFFVSSSGKIYAYSSISNYEKHFNDLQLYTVNADMNLEYIDTVTGSLEMMFVPSNRQFIVYKNKNSWIKFDEILQQKQTVYTMKDIQWSFRSLESEFPTEKWYSLSNGTYVLKSMKNVLLFDKDMKSQTAIISNTDAHYEPIVTPKFEKNNKLRWKGERFLHHDELLLHKKTSFHEKESIVKKTGLKETEMMGLCSCKISQVKFSERYMSYVKERSDKSPTLFFLRFDERKEHSVYQTNKWDMQAYDLKSEYVKWFTPDSLPRGVIVRYPLDYNSKKSYPAIFNIYEQKYYFQNDYMPKREASYNGFNWRDYVAEGYFVIEPDIYYKTGETGKMIVDYIENTLSFLKRYNKSIDTDRMGIIGHSFGGYEVNHLISELDAFKAAVSGASVSNFTSAAFDINKSTMRNNAWKFFGVQHRIGSLVYTNPEVYMKSSPIFKSKQIKTPLLIWHGKKDHLINYKQSISFFNSLDYYDKPVKLLLFENEGHIIQSKENKKILSDTVLDWFNKFLK